jgi:demethylmenaquinone methyltransferase/2-methoxy-6-polyprenyl-1,4-benzoquinol methylase
MPNKFYEPGEGRSARVRDLFAAVARRYDLINDLQSLGLHRLWKRKLVALAAPQPGERALDLCCGTGDLAFRLARRGAEVVGLDFSEAMLEVARARVQRRPKPHGDGNAPVERLRWLRGDGMRLPFKEGTFDIVTVGYGLRNLADWRRGLAEMLRVARPGGRLLVLDFGKPSQSLWRCLYLAYLRLVVPVFGRVFCGDAQTYAYILESLQHFPAQLGIAEALRARHCQDVCVLNLAGGAMGLICARRGP